MLGKSISVLLTFQGPQVPFYLKVDSAYTRCRSHRRSVQYCKACGEVGHRQDVCPLPNANHCPRCGEKVTPEGHEFHPRCKICDQPHETEGKVRKRRLKPGPPPLHVRKKNARGNQLLTWNADTREKAQHSQQGHQRCRVVEEAGLDGLTTGMEEKTTSHSWKAGEGRNAIKTARK
ncbi:hypothetical protein HPB47_003856 [Ixodes persulcatus]|uniref:Uncharacterized protein n=1 Tax=Ixodes persulcatus TaxID=34615 RepID=A0AC60PIB3_IXOPE|nr:hypothetical protein HPB47_003856 [Ixodes persulcatus]